MGFGYTGKVCANSRGEKGHGTVPKRLANYGKIGVCINHGLTLVIKNSHTYCKSLLSPRSKALHRIPLGGGLVGFNHRTIITAHKDFIRPINAPTSSPCHN